MHVWENHIQPLLSDLCLCLSSLPHSFAAAQQQPTHQHLQQQAAWLGLATQLASYSSAHALHCCNGVILQLLEQLGATQPCSVGQPLR